MNRPLLLLSSALAVFACGVPAVAGAPADGALRFFVSTTADVASAPTHPFFDDGDLILVRDGEDPRPVFQIGHWAATTGIAIGDVDAVARRPGELPGTYRSFAFSFLSDEGAVKDGDVLGINAGGGFDVLISEATIVTALGDPSANVDVDAFDWDASGRLYFSLQNDLSGTLLGVVENGDVLRLEFDGTVQRVLTELDVEQRFFDATGQAVSIGDVHGLAVENGDVWVCIQSPSDFDGGILDTGASPSFVLTEAQAGLGGAEIDAFEMVEEGDLLPTIHMTSAEASAGASTTVFFHGDPGGVLLVLWSGASGFYPFASTPGFGAWFMDPADPWLATIPTLPALPLAPLDGTGRYQVDYTMPAAVAGPGFTGNVGWTYQVIDVSSLELSAPFRVDQP